MNERFELRSLAADPVLAQTLAERIPDILRATGPVSWDFQFGKGDLLERVVAASWPTPETFFAAAGCTVALDQGTFAGLEMGYAGADFYRFKDKLAELAPPLIAAGLATPEELIGLMERAETASYLNAHVPADVYYVQALYTPPDRRGSGAGKALLKSAVARARAAGFRQLQLDVLSDNPATDFYRANGLQVLADITSPRLSRDHGFPSEMRMAISL